MVLAYFRGFYLSDVATRSDNRDCRLRLLWVDGGYTGAGFADWEKDRRRKLKVKGSVLDIDILGKIWQGWVMARKLRVEYPGAIYHVMTRGNRREAIFRDDRDRETFLTTLGEARGKTGGLVQGLCRIGSHFHLVVETRQGYLFVELRKLGGR